MICTTTTQTFGNFISKIQSYCVNFYACTRRFLFLLSHFCHVLDTWAPKYHTRGVETSRRVNLHSKYSSYLLGVSIPRYDCRQYDD